MAIDLTTLTDYTWAQVKLAAKHAMVRAAVGGATLTINGRSFGSIAIDDAKKLYDFATQMEADEAEGDNGGGNALVRIGERV